MLARLPGALLIAAFAATLLLRSSAAWAADAGGYIGASLGVSSEPTSCWSDLMNPPRCEGNAAVVRGFLGYAFRPELAIEAGVSAFEGSDKGGLDLSAIATMPLGERAGLYGRLGAFSIDGDVRPTYGIGLRFDVGESSALRVEWQSFDGSDVLFLGLMGRF